MATRLSWKHVPWSRIKTSRRARARGIRNAIGELLIREWDPIGVNDVPECQDEYDFYIGGVYRVLASGASAQMVADYLWELEKEEMGLRRPNSRSLLGVAAKLCALDITVSQH